MESVKAVDNQDEVRYNLTNERKSKMKIKTTTVYYNSMLYGHQTYDGPNVELERDEIADACPNGFMTVNGKSENTATLYLKTWKPGGTRNYSPGIACTIHVLERDLKEAFPDLWQDVQDMRVKISRAPDPDHGSCS